MAQSRRVPLHTLARHDPPSSFTSAARQVDVRQDRPADPGGQGPPPPGPGAPTVRLVLSLFEPDEQRFPEFSYSQLLDRQVGLS